MSPSRVEIHAAERLDRRRSARSGRGFRARYSSSRGQIAGRNTRRRQLQQSSSDHAVSAEVGTTSASGSGRPRRNRRSSRREAALAATAPWFDRKLARAARGHCG
jgi:hypothetical protein